MTTWLDKKYIQLVSVRLEGFVQKSSNLFNSKCPLCGDSKTNKAKKRLYFYVKGNSFQVHCHNCGYHSSVKYFLKQIDIGLYNQYRMDELKEVKRDTVTQTNVAVYFDNSVWGEELKSLKKISQLAIGHPARVYVESRKIPTPFHSILRWTPSFMKWTNGLMPEKFSAENMGLDEGRVVIPYFSFDKKFFAYSGRAIGEAKSRYILIVLDKSFPLLYGMNGIDLSKKVTVVEGPIDSLFLNNCIALSGSNIGSLTSVASSDRFVICFDNEPRKIETKNKISLAINNGFRVVIFPTWVEYKDINAMILAGWSQEYIQELIGANTFSGLAAKIKLEEIYR